MKYLILIACLLGSSAMAQNKDSVSFKYKGGESQKGILTGSSATRWEMLPNASSYSIKPARVAYFQMFSKGSKILMTIPNPPDSSGVFKVWFDKRAFTLTSDSTFTIQAPINR